MMRWKVVNDEAVQTTEHADEVNVFLSKSQALHAAGLVKDEPKKKVSKSIKKRLKIQKEEIDD